MSNQERENEDLEQEDVQTDSPFFADLDRGELSSENALRTDSLAPLPCPSVEAAGTALDGKSSTYFAALDSNIGNLQQRTQQLIDKVNDNRKKDHTVMSNFRESLLLKVTGPEGGEALGEGSRGSFLARGKRLALCTVERGEQKVSGLAEKLEERMFHLYDLHNKLIQEKLQELSEVMERMGRIQAELRQVCHTVEAAYKDLCLQPEP
ncbi:synaptonemal complex central element protein 2 [Struthio camelus]|uniref:synaptonemal complex central element protein 2 n=1 Tax=Struthio camelus TaxID=8801 RepID=UPI003603C3FD